MRIDDLFPCPHASTYYVSRGATAIESATSGRHSTSGRHLRTPQMQMSDVQFVLLLQYCILIIITPFTRQALPMAPPMSASSPSPVSLLVSFVQ